MQGCNKNYLRHIRLLKFYLKSNCIRKSLRKVSTIYFCKACKFNKGINQLAICPSFSLLRPSQQNSIDKWIKQQKFVFSQFWRLEVQDHRVSTFGCSWGLIPCVADSCLLAVSSHGLVFVSDYILRYWWLGFQHTMYEGIHFSTQQAHFTNLCRKDGNANVKILISKALISLSMIFPKTRITDTDDSMVVS